MKYTFIYVSTALSPFLIFFYLRCSFFEASVGKILYKTYSILLNFRGWCYTVKTF